MASPATTDARVAEIRAFNRFYTNRIGVLRGGLHGARHPLPEARHAQWGVELVGQEMVLGL
ncbi:MAG TPA: hypothetical protein VGO71_12265 [Baekduia sp.]|jgi:hypothetical protein|nr:hypothetical protein [Baekduia sp.]